MGTLVPRLAMVAAATVTAFAATSVEAQVVRGSAALETRVFTQSPGYPDQRRATVSPSIVFEPDLTWESAGGDWQLRARPFVRLDAHDGNRTHVDLREGGLLWLGSRWTVFGGVGKVFWGKTEARHLVDVVNQTDGVEDIDDEDKLGQPMVSATLELPNGALDVFLLPYFRERTFADARGRLRGPARVGEQASYDGDAGRWHQDLAARLSWYTGSLDLAVSAFRGTSREPRLVLLTAADQPTLRPHYDLIDQVSIDAQWTAGATLWKLEALTRAGHGSRFGAATVGVEHTFFGIGSSTADLGVLGEWMVDGRDRQAPVTAFDHDVFIGARLALNDTSDTSVLGGPIVDYRTGEAAAFIEAERRVGEAWVIGVEGRWLFNADAGSPFSALAQDDFITLRLSRYF